uniref:Myrosinase 1-like n=1 Tax=Diabrotica virgifera virgifera TaxID=50390 RepID=A0A6P7GYQ3_DIAVI
MVRALHILATLLALQLSYGDPQPGYPVHPNFPPKDCEPYPVHYPHPIPEPACEIPVIPPPHYPNIILEPVYEIPVLPVIVGPILDYDDCDYPYPGYPHGPINPGPLPPHLPLPHHLPIPEPCGGLPDWLVAWPNEWPRYFPCGWPDDWPCDFPLGLPNNWPIDFPHGLPHDWPNHFPHGWLPDNLPHGYPNAWPCDWPENWRDYWPDCWPNYWNDCELPIPLPHGHGYPHGPYPGPGSYPGPGPLGPYPGPGPLPLPHNLPYPHPSLPIESCDVIPYSHGSPHGLPYGLPQGWPNEWPRHFPNGWPDNWPCGYPLEFVPEYPQNFPHGLPHDWPNNFPHGWPLPHGYPNDWPCEWPDNWQEYWPDCWPNYWDGCDYPYPAGSVPAVPPPPESCDVFPKGFSFGVSSGAYHIEGAWDQDCKSENIWDRWLHTCPSVVIDGSNGDISADAYNHIKGDIELLNNLTVRHYVFSISWSRVIYDGCGEVNPYGIEHYRTLIKLLKLNHIEPIVVLYNGDLPQALQDQGGFLCPSFVEWYTEYARVCFECFGDDVKYWITFHKPTVVCKDGYGQGTYPPGINDGPGNYEYICGHNLLKAHAAAYHLYDDYYRPCQNGKISITLSSDWYEPQSCCDTDLCASETKLQFQIGWFAHPIYLGDYPEVMIERIRLTCDYNGYYNARLPVFSHAEIEYIKGTHDFFALAYESAFYVTPACDNYWGNICYESDVGVQLISCEGDLVTAGIRSLLGWISRNYYNPSVFITGNGYATCSRDCYDCDRIEHIKAILRSVRLSMIEDYTRVYGYTYYSYIDGFEWSLIDGRLAGYTRKYGLYDVEFDCPQKTRTARSSVAYYQHLASTGCIDNPCPIPYCYDYNYDYYHY